MFTHSYTARSLFHPHGMAAGNENWLILCTSSILSVFSGPTDRSIKTDLGLSMKQLDNHKDNYLIVWFGKSTRNKSVQIFYCLNTYCGEKSIPQKCHCQLILKDDITYSKTVRGDKVIRRQTKS